MKVELIDYTENGIRKIAKLARATRKVSLETDEQYLRNIDDLRDIKGKDEKFVKSLLKVNHLGILEYINFTFHVSEISRALTHQLVRHRIASYLQMSSRHVKPDKKGYVVPITIGDENAARDIYDQATRMAFEHYKVLVEDYNIPIEDARYILPPAFYTHISITMNARELRHFFELRCDKHAQWEIRELSNRMLKICYEKYPIIFEDLYERCKEE
jgi:thymidylate synthase (FAD)